MSWLIKELGYKQFSIGYYEPVQEVSRENVNALITVYYWYELTTVSSLQDAIILISKLNGSSEPIHINSL